jgi:predicted enzyme related to lactoylglutathione lyase
LQYTGKPQALIKKHFSVTLKETLEMMKNPAIKLLVYPVKDPAQAKKLYSTFLGVEPYVDSPYYIGFRLEGLEIGLDPAAGQRGESGPIGYADVRDVRLSLKSLLEAGAQLLQDVQDVGAGLLIAKVQDGSGNLLGLRQSNPVQ